MRSCPHHTWRSTAGRLSVVEYNYYFDTVLAHWFCFGPQSEHDFVVGSVWVKWIPRWTGVWPGRECQATNSSCRPI